MSAWRAKARNDDMRQQAAFARFTAVSACATVQPWHNPVTTEHLGNIMAKEKELFDTDATPLRVTLTLTPMQAFAVFEAIGGERDQAPAMKIVRQQIAQLLGIER